MPSFSPTVPLNKASETGFTMNSTISSVIKQNFKMLLLTSPGERVMDPDFGVGIKRYLFETFDASVYGQIETRIKIQTTTYLPSIRILNIAFSPGREGSDFNRLGVTIKYSIRGIGVQDSVEI
jgi:phage baseplate assembly protein W